MVHLFSLPAVLSSAPDDSRRFNLHFYESTSYFLTYIIANQGTVFQILNIMVSLGTNLKQISCSILVVNLFACFAKAKSVWR